MHNDEAGVGRAVKESGISREKIWITSKLWPTEYGESKTLEAIDKILEHMQLDLFTSQLSDFVGAWRDMGKVRALGISNFDANDEAFEKIMIESRVKPAVLQIECHSYAQRLAIRDKVKPYGIHITCWFLLGGAMSNGALFSLSSDK
ncbi:aldo/keto reductase [Phocaeicola dorei]|nr:aldo/keto reductase [Phocaeicola dorei]WHX15305.1 aldo/keto reductase [Phocaeicola dorei]